MNQDTPD